MTLDVAEAGLRQASIPFLRFDGRVPQKDRQTVVDRFRNDPSIKVLLLTLSCGAVGLVFFISHLYMNILHTDYALGLP